MLDNIHMKLSVIGVAFNASKDKVLVIKRRDVTVWTLPGGGVDEGESPESAVLREIYEETGVKAAIVRKVAEYTPINRLGGYTHIFECRANDETTVASDETLGAGFYPVNELPKIFFFIHEEWIHEALANHPEVLTGTLDQITYWNLFKFLFKHPVHVIRFVCSKLGFPINS